MLHGTKQETFATGAVRDTQTGKPRPDLASPHATRRKAIVYAQGAAHYGERNYEKGMPLTRILASMSRHLLAWQLGDESEDHLAQLGVNVDFALHMEEGAGLGFLPPELLDLPKYQPLTDARYTPQEASITDQPWPDVAQTPPEVEPLACVDGEPCVLGCQHHGQCYPGNQTEEEKRRDQEDILRFGVLPPADHAALEAKVVAANIMDEAVPFVDIDFAAGPYYADVATKFTGTIDLTEAADEDENRLARYANSLAAYISYNGADLTTPATDESEAPDDFSDLAFKVEPPKLKAEYLSWQMYKGSFKGPLGAEYLSDGETILSRQTGDVETEWAASNLYPTIAALAFAVDGGKIQKVAELLPEDAGPPTLSEEGGS